jgi:Cdc6-like AAA superfamily ATPase
MKDEALTNAEKQEIREKTKIYIERFGSMNKAANSLRGVSVALLSIVANKKWNMISDEKFRLLDSQLDCPTGEWVGVDTRDHLLLKQILKDAQNNSLVCAVTADAGSGKSHTSKDYTRTHRRVYRLTCNEFWNKKDFLKSLLAQLGRKNKGLTAAEMISEITSIVVRQKEPLIILDEIDKLNDSVLYFFITLYNELEGYCGIVLLSTDYMKKRITRGLNSNKKGYQEIYSRIGRKFIELRGVSYNDVMSICVANGIIEKVIIDKIHETSENDLRRVKRRVHAIKQQRLNAA